MFDSLRKTHKGEQLCEGVLCEDCPLQGIGCACGCANPFNVVEIYNIVEKWSKEHLPKKFKVSQLEYDILESIIKTVGSGLYFFELDSLLMDLLKKGYFKGATHGTEIKEYFYNCEVVNENSSDWKQNEKHQEERQNGII